MDAPPPLLLLLPIPKPQAKEEEVEKEASTLPPSLDPFLLLSSISLSSPDSMECEGDGEQGEDFNNVFTVFGGRSFLFCYVGSYS